MKTLYAGFAAALFLFLVLGPEVLAQSFTPVFEGTYQVKLQEKINGESVIQGKNGINIFADYMRIVYRYVAALVGIFCVLVMVVSGIQISLGGANNEMVSQARQRIVNSLISLVLLFCSSLILTTINPAFFGSGGFDLSGLFGI